jgi:Ser/Thr protein kinase RdoA (MazF antagonist)
MSKPLGSGNISTPPIQKVLRREWDIGVETIRAVTKLRDHGVEHSDVRPPNVLWNPEKAMLVDFERSAIQARYSFSS